MLKGGFYETNPFSVLLRHIPMDCCLWQVETYCVMAFLTTLGDEPSVVQ
jgi:hypothetical protein